MGSRLVRGKSRYFRLWDYRAVSHEQLQEQL
jgi:hypothetical protein